MSILHVSDPRVPLHEDGCTSSYNVLYVLILLKKVFSKVPNYVILKLFKYIDMNINISIRT